MFEQKMLRCPLARNAAKQRRRACARGGDQVRHGLDGVLRIGNHHERKLNGLTDDGEIVECVIGQRLVGGCGDRV
jgi:hypothetical protein